MAGKTNSWTISEQCAAQTFYLTYIIAFAIHKKMSLQYTVITWLLIIVKICKGNKHWYMMCSSESLSTKNESRLMASACHDRMIHYSNCLRGLLSTDDEIKFQVTSINFLIEILVWMNRNKLLLFAVIKIHAFDWNRLFLWFWFCSHSTLAVIFSQLAPKSAKFAFHLGVLRLEVHLLLVKSIISQIINFLWREIKPN